jgi:hypothetical protein
MHQIAFEVGPRLTGFKWVMWVNVELVQSAGVARAPPECIGTVVLHPKMKPGT